MPALSPDPGRLAAGAVGAAGEVARAARPRRARSTPSGEEWTRAERGRPADRSAARPSGSSRQDGLTLYRRARADSSPAVLTEAEVLMEGSALVASRSPRSSSSVLLVIVCTSRSGSCSSTRRWSSSGWAGRTRALVRDPGLRFLIPIIDRPVKVDLREQFIEVPSQTTITKDNAPINVDFLIYWRIVDPLKSVVNVAYFAGALQGVATTTLRAVIGDILLDDVLSQARADQRGAAHQARRGDRALGRQGHDGRDPRDHPAARRPGRDEPAALRRADAARRDHRVGGRAASRRSTSPRAQKQAAILRAEGERQSAILRAEGFSAGPQRRIFSRPRTRRRRRRR